MANLQILRGNQADLTTLLPGEPAIILDRKKAVFGTAGGNVVIHDVRTWANDLTQYVDDIVVYADRLWICKTQVIITGVDTFQDVSSNYKELTSKDSKVVADITARDAITGIDLFNGLLCFVSDASADITVSTGAALYVYNDSAWTKLTEFEGLDLVIPTAAEGTEGRIAIATQVEIDAGTDDAHAVTALKLRSVTGDKTSLTTTDKTSAVSAINEVNQKVDNLPDHASMITRTDANVSVSVLSTDQLVRLSATTAGASQTVTLPLISSVFDGKLVTIAGQGTNTYPALINPGVANTIKGGAITLNEDGQSVTLVANLTTSQWEVVAHVKPSVVGAVSVQNNFAGTTAPGVGNDASQGYSEGSVWLDVVSTPKESYKCAVSTIGNAVWVKTSLTYDELPSSRLVTAHASGSGNTTYPVGTKLLVITMASTDNVQVTLGASATYPDEIKIKRLGSGTGQITILPNGAETMDGVGGLFDATPFLSTSGDLLALEPATLGFILA